ncbi:hypothetical protein J4573_42185 [Actinomadura barringtoniae]|uniref:DNA recombination-mediator protein A n=1 Tax=Actinomadura barringtoniae TaxID=1427535 RepID=A0A939T909_9ACTN|nr:hypothetical protein [Actinomadura barringtoniae]MBO2453759.1 hypothetical protein [Actinomadura barringtoniae]
MTITGTRSTEHRPSGDYREIFGQYVAPFARPGVRFYLGGAKGIDSLCLLWLAEETRAELVVVVPAALGDQPADARHAVAAVRQAGRLEQLVELGAEPRTSGYHARDRWMVDRSEMVIGFPLRGTSESGTHYTLGYATNLDRTRLILPV